MQEIRAGIRSPGVSKRADVAQLVEHSLGKGEVTSSILVISSISSSGQLSVVSQVLGGEIESASICTGKLITDN